MVQASLGSAIVGPTRKILLGSAVSNDLEFCAPENASVIIGRILSDHTARNFDHYVFDDIAADENGAVANVVGNRVTWSPVT
jgi:hypothetical protein